MDLEAKVAVLENCYVNLAGVVVEEKRRLNGNLERIDRRLAGIEGEALRKPTWGVTAAISTLLSLVVGLGTYLVTR